MSWPLDRSFVGASRVLHFDDPSLSLSALDRQTYEHRLEYFLLCDLGLGASEDAVQEVRDQVSLGGAGMRGGDDLR